MPASSTKLEFSTLTLEFSTLTLEFSTLTLEFSTLTLSFPPSQARIFKKQFKAYQTWHKICDGVTS
jgi:hypothetical protein